MKEKGVISRLFQYMGIFKITMAISFVLAAISAVVNLSAYTCIYNVAKEIVTSWMVALLLWKVVCCRDLCYPMDGSLVIMEGSQL